MIKFGFSCAFIRGVVQGHGVMWFFVFVCVSMHRMLAAMSSVAYVRPEMIYALFGGPSRKVSPCGQYSVRLFDSVTRSWQYVIVDDLLPFYDGKLAYLQSKNEVHNQQVWSALLEKAVAKLVGGYSEYESRRKVVVYCMGWCVVGGRIACSYTNIRLYLVTESKFLFALDYVWCMTCACSV